MAKLTIADSGLAKPDFPEPKFWLAVNTTYARMRVSHPNTLHKDVWDVVDGCVLRLVIPEGIKKGIAQVSATPNGAPLQFRARYEDARWSDDGVQSLHEIPRIIPGATYRLCAVQSDADRNARVLEVTAMVEEEGCYALSSRTVGLDGFGAAINGAWARALCGPKCPHDSHFSRSAKRGQDKHSEFLSRVADQPALTLGDVAGIEDLRGL